VSTLEHERRHFGLDLDTAYLNENCGKVTYDVGGRYILAVNSDAAAREKVLEQLTILGKVAQNTPLLPKLVGVNEATGSYLYHKVPGTVFSQELQNRQPRSTQATNARLLASVIHAFASQPWEGYRHLTRPHPYRVHPEVWDYFHRTDPAVCPLYERAVDLQAGLDSEEVLLHGDLHGLNMIVDADSHLVGVIDWSALSIGPFERDFKFFFSFGDEFMARVLDEYERVSGRRIALRTMLTYNLIESFSNFYYSFIDPQRRHFDDRRAWVYDALAKVQA